MKHIDLHVVVVVLMVLLIVVLALPLKVAAIVIVALPQPLVFVRAMDHRRAGASVIAFLIANEVVIATPSLLCLLVGLNRQGS